MNIGVGDMVQPFRMWTAFEEVLSSIPRTVIEQLKTAGNSRESRASVGTALKYTCLPRNTSRHVIKNKRNLFKEDILNIEQVSPQHIDVSGTLCAR